jgi:hypothetical protein
MAKSNIPRHIGFIPDGNRRWAVDHGLPKEAGYAHGIDPGLLLFEKCKECGIKETSIYYQRENPRLCRGGSSSLTFPGVHPETLRREPPSTRRGETGWTSMPA